MAEGQSWDLSCLPQREPAGDAESEAQTGNRPLADHAEHQISSAKHQRLGWRRNEEAVNGGRESLVSHAKMAGYGSIVHISPNMAHALHLCATKTNPWMYLKINTDNNNNKR